MAEPVAHAYDVTPVYGGTVRYRANSTCHTPFELRISLAEAGLDGLDHVRACEGRPSRRTEIEVEAAAKKTASDRRRGR